MVEIDFFGHPDGFQLGHKAIGHQIATAAKTKGNPPSLNFVDWINVVRDILLPLGRRHLPLLLFLDVKNDHLARVKTAQEHNLATLNHTIETAFRDKLLSVDAFERMGRRPLLGDLAGRVIVVLTGHEKTRFLYRHDSGFTPCVSVSLRQHVLEVHCARPSGNGALWYWIGRLCDAMRDPVSAASPDASVAAVEWLQHGWLKVKGHHPSAALNSDGWIVCFYECDNPVGFGFGFGGHSLRYVTAQVSLSASFPVVQQRQNITLPQDGFAPFVDLCDDNSIVLSFFESTATLCVKFGRLDPATAQIAWCLSRSMPTVPRPSVSSLSLRFRDRQSASAADLHVLQRDGASFSASFADLPASLESDVVPAPAAHLGLDRCPVPQRAVAVLVSSSDSLVFYSIVAVAQLQTEPFWLPIRFRQLCFIDHHPYDTLVKPSEAYFHSHHAGRNPGQWAARREGELKFMRAWRFNAPLWSAAIPAHVNLVATDFPFDQGFLAFCRANRVLLDTPAFLDFGEAEQSVAAVESSSSSSSSSSSEPEPDAAAAYSSCPPGYWD